MSNPVLYTHERTDVCRSWYIIALWQSLWRRQAGGKGDSIAAYSNGVKQAKETKYSRRASIAPEYSEYSTPLLRATIVCLTKRGGQKRHLALSESSLDESDNATFVVFQPNPDTIPLIAFGGKAMSRAVSFGFRCRGNTRYIFLAVSGNSTLHYSSRICAFFWPRICWHTPDNTKKMLD